MFFVYVLHSETAGRFYIGSTSDLERRLAEHNSNLATATKNRGPWRLVHRECFPTRGAAIIRERYLKTGKGRREIQKLLETSAVSSRLGGVEVACPGAPWAASPLRHARYGEKSPSSNV